MQVELVKTVTSDEIVLDGAFFAPEDNGPQDRAIDAILMVHGSAGSFYGGLIADQAERFRNAGYAVASFNTTGHSLVWGQAGSFFGNATEILDRCRLDIAAGIDWLESRRYRRIAIFGHSMGAVKVVYYQAFVQDPRVAAVISSSPVRLSHNYFLQSEGAEEYRQHYEKAKALIDAGRPDAFFETTFPMPHLFSARGYIDKHGPEERYTLTKYTNRVKCPLLIMAGSLETHPRLLDCAKDMYATITDNPNAKLVIQEGADHGWSEMREPHAQHVLDFLGQLTKSQVGAPAND